MNGAADQLAGQGEGSTHAGLTYMHVCMLFWERCVPLHQPRRQRHLWGLAASGGSGARGEAITRLMISAVRVLGRAEAVTTA